MRAGVRYLAHNVRYVHDRVAAQYTQFKVIEKYQLHSDPLQNLCPIYHRSIAIAQRSKLARYSWNNTMRIATARRARSWRSSEVA